MKKILTIVAGLTLAASAFATSAPTGAYVLVQCPPTLAANSYTGTVVTVSDRSQAVDTKTYTTCGAALDGLADQGYSILPNASGTPFLFTLVK